MVLIVPLNAGTSRSKLWREGKKRKGREEGERGEGRGEGERGGGRGREEGERGGGERGGGDLESERERRREVPCDPKHPKQLL